MKIKRLPKVDRGLLWVILILLAFGLVSLYSASSVLSSQRFGNNYYYFVRQIGFGAIPGLIAMYVLSRIDYHVWQKLAPLLIVGGVGLLVAVLLPGIGLRVAGARRWINLQYFLFQPAEFVKLAVIFYLASWYDKRQQHTHDLYYGFLPILTIVLIVSGLIILEPDLGTMLVLIAIAAVMFFLGGVRLRYLFGTAVVGSMVLWLAIKAAPYRASRLLAFFNPQADAQGVSYQINQALLAIGSGGFWGRGYGQSLQKQNYLPETIGDSIFAVISEEMGFVRILAVLIGFLFLALRGFRVALKAPDTFGRLVAAGITSWIVMQAIINIGGITAVIPLTGIPLPFISYGSTAMAMNLGALGILLNISRYTGKRA
ncbi:MAG TPA: putative lipid II flippase FtsW [Patescibacteria group bacterium]|nr:putative lipid II flippase FtsW [Patescibacteria group bacterium]